MNAIPEVDVVVISHNHYDHMDVATITALRDQHNPHFFAPLNNDEFFLSLDIASTHYHCLDWWDDSEVSVSLPGSKVQPVQFRLTCTPAQHQSRRGPFDSYRSLWSSWAVEELLQGNQGFKVWFAGDTGYRYVGPGQDEDAVPYCPAFQEIGSKLGGVDLGLIPIGPYNPRATLSAVHASPSDAVRIFKDIKAKKAIGMHWG